MNISDAILKRRTIRKFTQTKIDSPILVDLVNAARLAPTAANMQPLKYAILTDDELLQKIFPHTKWAGYLTDGAPNENECPTAYIAILGDKDIKQEFSVDAGSAAATILLAAMEHNLASCWLGALNRSEIMKILNLDENKFSLLYLIALGYPMQKSKAVDMINGDVKYIQDNSGIIHVPKRSTDEVLILQN